ncbi:MAG: hypothetical protein DRP66_06085 [Planctomycetota bacterium]|nr:MAG: hypothetical protein DRP66_06085 [Planctomycetota bacterium]
MANLHSLTANNLGIWDLTGLEYATEVNELHLSGNLISDLSPISALTNLIYLYLNDNQITDISAVSSLVNLDTLFLSINDVNDISPVSGLTGLTSLYLGSNQIINISSLSGLSNLTMLDLTDNQVVDISVVSNLTSMEQLYLADNQIVDIPDMSTLTNLQYLHLTNNQISDIAGLAGEEPNDLVSLLLRGNTTLNQVTYCTYLPEIIINNPLISVEVDDNPYTCLHHDICSNAVVVTKGVANTYSDSTAGATGAEKESICGLWDYYDVWHSYTPDSNEVVDISLCGSSLDTTLVVYDSCGGTELVCNDDYCDYQSLVTAALTGGETYMIRVAGYDETTGDYDLTITDAPEPPYNNTCQDANEVVPYSPPVTGSTTLAYGTDITSCTTGDTRDVWYYLIPTISGRYLIDANDSDYDTSLAVFDDCGGTELVCNDDYCNYDYFGRPDNVTSRIIVSLVEGETYYIRISGYAGGGGNYSLKVTLASDINKDGVVDIFDLMWLAGEWLQDGTSDADIAPDEAGGGGDKFIDLRDVAELCNQWSATP